MITLSATAASGSRYLVNIMGNLQPVSAVSARDALNMAEFAFFNKEIEVPAPYRRVYELDGNGRVLAVYE